MFRYDKQIESIRAGRGQDGLRLCFGSVHVGKSTLGGLLSQSAG